MGVTKEAAFENRQKILAAAGRLFRQKGVDAVGLTELMKEAGFTQGGFYNHFKSKDALVAEVLTEAANRGVDELASAIDASLAAGIDPLSRQITWYLSPKQRDDIECGCSMAGFAGDVPRLTREAQVSYADALRRTIEQLGGIIRIQRPALSQKAARSKALALYSQMVGALLLSRATSAGDPQFANSILEHARKDLLREFADPAKQSATKR